MAEKNVIYILTNPSFPQYVKIGYADNVESQLKQLNNSECIPFAFRTSLIAFGIVGFLGNKTISKQSNVILKVYVLFLSMETFVVSGMISITRGSICQSH